MTPLELVMIEISNSKYLATEVLKTIKNYKPKKMRFNVTNLEFDFKTKKVSIQDEIGVADIQIQVITIEELIKNIKNRHS